MPWRSFALPFGAFLLGGAMVAGWQSWGQAPALDPPIIALPPPPVQVAKPGRRNVVRSIELPGDVSAYQQARLYAKVAGYLEKVLVDKGDRVKARQLLAVIQAPELEREVLAARQAYQAALAKREVEKAALKLQQTTYRRLKRVFDQDPGLLARQDLDIAQAKVQEARARLALAEAELKAAQQAARRAVDMQRYTEIRAPFAGTIAQRLLDPGTLMQSAAASAQGATQPVMEMVDDERVRIYVHVPEPEISKAHPGTEVTVRPEAYPNRQMLAQITRVAGSLDSSTRTLLAEIELANADHRLKPGMFVKVTIRLEARPDALVVPTSALMVEKDERAVFVVRDGKAEKLAVKTGFEGPEWTEIVGGLTGEEAVIVIGKERVSRGGTVEVVTRAGGA
jgi:membrane fusion protein, multidrug efflux system